MGRAVTGRSPSVFYPGAEESPAVARAPWSRGRDAVDWSVEGTRAGGALYGAASNSACTRGLAHLDA
eukprot:1137013-Pyramimonas_sp.AAC.1